MKSGRYNVIDKKLCKKESISCLEARSNIGKTGKSLKELDATNMNK